MADEEQKTTLMEEGSIELPQAGPERHMNVGEVLKERNFRMLWVSQAFSQVAGHMLNFTLVILLYQRTHSNALVSLLIALVSVPPILFSSLAGVYADNFSRKKILLGSNLTRCLIVLLLLFVNSVPVAILVIAFVVSTISQFFGPAESSSIASLIHRRGYFSANSLFVFTTYTSFLVGYTIAGPALTYFGEQTTYLILAACFLLASIANINLPALRDHLEHRKERSIAERAFGSFRTEVWAGVHYIRDNHFLLLVVIIASSIFAFERAVISLLPDLAENTFRYSVDQLSYYIITPAGLGAFAGAGIANLLKHKVKKTTIITIGMVIAGLALMLFPLHGFFDGLLAGRGDLIAFIATLAFASGFGDVFIIIAAQTLIHESTTEETRGRVFGSLITLMNAIGLPLILIVGWLASIFPPVDIVFAIGVVTTGIVIASRIFFARLFSQHH